ncbi:MAG: hypothetical protein ACKO6K_10050, partial [Chitinophagaceae bacterium]
MALLRKISRLHLLVFPDTYDLLWYNDLLNTGLPVALSRIKEEIPVFAERQIMLYLDPDFEVWSREGSPFIELLDGPHRAQYLLTDDVRWRESGVNGISRILSRQTHAYE